MKNLEEYSRYEYVVENIKDIIWELDANFIFTYVSSSTKEATGYETDEVVGRCMFDLLTTESKEQVLEKWKNRLSNNDNSNRVILYEVEIICKDGSTIWFEVSVRPVVEEGKTVRYIGVSRDITEKKLYEAKFNEYVDELKNTNEKLRESEDAKNEFLTLISHEFKTPLTVINSAIQAMELICKDELSDKAKGFINKIRQNSNRQLKLINNLLDITRINSGYIKPNMRDLDIVFITRSITDSIKVYAEQKNIRLSFYSTLSKKVIKIDEEKYERVLLNLLSNAIKFTPEGKSISVKVSQKIVDRKCKVCIQVCDKGIGIPEDKKELIFERFGQVDNSLSRQAEGTGIGLYLVKMFIGIMGGQIFLESNKGVGSIFTILLPLERIKDTPIEQMVKEITDKRLIQATAIEFSDVYI